MRAHTSLHVDRPSSKEAPVNLWLANPRGFCAGVERAVKVVDELISLVDEPVYVRHEIVHNRAVVESLKARGAVFVEAIDEIPRGALAVVSAHGAPPEVFRDARAAGLRLFDATCPLVTKVHLEVIAHSRAGRAVFLVGHRGHVEVLGTLGHYDNPAGGGIHVVENEQDAREVQVPDPQSVAYVTQTTLEVNSANRIVAVLRERFPALIGPHHDDICYATQNRQDAVRMLCSRCPLVIVIGAPHSSNSVRMVEVAREAGAAAQLIESADAMQTAWFDGIADVGLTSSASAPEHLISDAVRRVHALVPRVTVRELGEPEAIVFKLPTVLIDMRASRRPAQVRPSTSS
jgi:4-hydroxy-3-methylbut-2-enyl diphosphate reductase